MTVLKENLVPKFIILLAGLIVSFAAVPLQNTEWAEAQWCLHGRWTADQSNDLDGDWWLADRAGVVDYSYGARERQWS